MHRSASTTTVYNELIEVCPWLRDTVEVWNGRDYTYNVDGVDFIFYFGRFKGVLPQIKIVDSLDVPLVGTNVTIENKVIATNGPNVYYDVLPFEQLYTYNTAPQVRATVDGMPVLCVGVCDFTYEASLSSITGVSVVGLDFQITGVDLPLDITKVQMGNQDCMVTSNDATQISCVIANSMSAGSWVPKVWTAAGLVPVDPALAAIDVALVVDSVAPSTLGDSGGELVTFTGSGFPSSVDSIDVKEITFTDGTICNIVSSTSVELVC